MVDENDEKQSDGEHTPPKEVGDLLAKFQKIFEDPKGLPPEISEEHSINIKEGCGSVVVRPYRYANCQKNEIE